MLKTYTRCPFHTLQITFRREYSQSSTLYNLNSAFTRRLFRLPTLPSSPSSHHHDLSSFLSYAKRTSLSSESTLYVGTHYEYTVQHSLRRFGFHLHRIGGRDDAGIDLVGTWHLPTTSSSSNALTSTCESKHNTTEAPMYQTIRVIVQCKSLRTKLGPNLVRELEGTFRHSPVGWRTGNKVGVLVSPREATKGVRDAMTRSAYPLCWMTVERDGKLRQALWNGKVEEEMGLGGALGVEARYTLGLEAKESDLGGGDIRATKTAAAATSPEVALTWNGNDVPDLDQVERDLSQREAQWIASWTAGESLSEAARMALLDIVEEIHPETLPIGVSAGTETVAALSGAERGRLLHLLKNRIENVT